jgi:hypothetical protein
MIGRIMASLFVLAFAGVAAPSPVSDLTDKSCRQHPQLIGECFNVRGRLSVYNGAPAVRLRRSGTRRMLGVSDQRFKLPEYRNLPEVLSQQLNGDNEILGDFLVCPFTKPRPREMQLVCIESARNLSIRRKQER